MNADLRVASREQPTASQFQQPVSTQYQQQWVADGQSNANNGAISRTSQQDTGSNSGGIRNTQYGYGLDPNRYTPSTTSAVDGSTSPTTRDPRYRPLHRDQREQGRAGAIDARNSNAHAIQQHYARIQQRRASRRSQDRAVQADEGEDDKDHDDDDSSEDERHR